MNLRHAAALALVGWYLMLPPEQGGPGQFNIHAPLSQWSLEGSFDTVDDCKRGQQDGLGKWFSAGEDAIKHAQTKERDKDLLMVAWYNYGECIASDDPRLKEK